MDNNVCTLITASHITDQDDVLHEEMSARAVMRHLPAEDRAKIQQQVELFRMEKLRLDREVSKWDDSGNDIIVLAKQMCVIMMEMTDFTRWVHDVREGFVNYMASGVREGFVNALWVVSGIEWLQLTLVTP